MARIWFNTDGTPIRGTIVQGDGVGSRQVVRRNMTQKAFNDVSRFNLPRRIRRSMSRTLMHRAFAAQRG